MRDLVLSRESSSIDLSVLSLSLKLSELILSYVILGLLVLSTFNLKELEARDKAPSNDKTITLYSGYLSRIECDGRLLVSAVGNDSLARIEALPKELGCGVLIKPLVATGQTNLIIETSSETYERILRVQPGTALPGRETLSIRLSGGRR